MDEPKRQIALLYFEPTQAFFYNSATTGLLQLTFPQDTYADQEIVNSEKFLAAFQLFFQQNSIVPSDFIIVLSPALTFEKEFTDNLTSSLTKEIQSFFDLVPFEEVLSKVYKISKKTIAVATNKQLCDESMRALEQLQSRVTAIVPLSIAQQVAPELQNLDIGVLFNKADFLKQYSLLIFEEQVSTFKTMPTEKKDKNRLYMLTGVFVMLLLVLVIVIFVTRR